MNNQKREIQNIEFNIRNDLDKMSHLKNLLTEKVASIKTNIALTEMLVMGFTLGYMIMPTKNAAKKPTRLASMIILVKIRKIVRAATAYLVGKR